MLRRLGPGGIPTTAEAIGVTNESGRLKHQGFSAETWGIAENLNSERVHRAYGAVSPFRVFPGPDASRHNNSPFARMGG